MTIVVSILPLTDDLVVAGPLYVIGLKGVHILTGWHEMSRNVPFLENIMAARDQFVLAEKRHDESVHWFYDPYLIYVVPIALALDVVVLLWLQVAVHRHGCCVLQRCLDAAGPKLRVKLVDEVRGVGWEKIGSIMLQSIPRWVIVTEVSLGL